VYSNSTAQGQAFLDSLYGIPFAVNPFDYIRTSVIQLDSMHQWVPGGDHMAINLGHVPSMIFYNVQDFGLQLDQNQEMWDWATVSGATNFELHTVPGPANLHRWSTLDEVTACTWFDSKSLQIPLKGNLLMDRDARFLQFDLEQTTLGQFSRLAFDGQAPQAIHLLDTLHATVLEFSPSDFGKTTGVGDTLTITLSAQDTADTIILHGVPNAPVNVVRDSIAELNWLYSPQDSTLKLTETDPAAHVWEVHF